MPRRHRATTEQPRRKQLIIYLRQAELYKSFITTVFFTHSILH